MAKIAKETFERIIHEVYGLDIPADRLDRIVRGVNQTLEALENRLRWNWKG